MKEVEVFGQKYTIAPLTTGQMEDLVEQGAKPAEVNRGMVAASLTNGGKSTSAAEMRDLEWRAYRLLLDAVLEVNGIEVPKGEVAAAATAS